MVIGFYEERLASAFLGQSVACHPEVALGGWGKCGAETSLGRAAQDA